MAGNHGRIRKKASRHGKHKLHQCPHCDKVDRKGRLDVHIRLKHGGPDGGQVVAKMVAKGDQEGG